MYKIWGVILPLIKLKRQDVYIYGDAKEISGLILFLWQNEIQVKGIINPNLQKEIERAEGIKVFPSSYLDQLSELENVFVIIAGAAEVSDIILFQRSRIKNYCMLTETEYYSIYGEYASTNDGTAAISIDYFRDNYENFKEILSALKDDASREILLEWIRVFMQRSVYKLPECEGRYKYFYGLSKDGGYEKIYTHKSDEVWFNCGANIGDNIFLYFANGLEADMIYAVEGDENIYKKLCRNLKKLPSSYREKIMPINAFINDKTDFQMLFSGKTISLINADIQGYEAELLKDCKELIIRDRPVLAICVYHHAYDLIDLYSYIDSIVDGYSYKLRKYPGGDPQKLWELVLYAIPDERNINE